MRDSTFTPTKALGIIMAVWAMLTIVFMLSLGCITETEHSLVKANPINAPSMRFIYNTPVLAEWNGLERSKCGATARAFRTYVRWLIDDEGWDAVKVKYVYGNVAGAGECVRYAVVYMKRK